MSFAIIAAEKKVKGVHIHGAKEKIFKRNFLVHREQLSNCNVAMLAAELLFISLSAARHLEVLQRYFAARNSLRNAVEYGLFVLEKLNKVRFKFEDNERL